jgi:2-polyprenyl-3-methyl-5-hydroxy-6-metoxy-1,4-benzoquinol methylase
VEAKDNEGKEGKTLAGLELLKLMDRHVLEKVPCAICGGTDFKQLQKLDRYYLDLSVVVCKKCDLIQVNPRLGEEFYDEFYDKHYRDLHDIENRIGDLDAYFDWQYKRAIEVFGDVKEDRSMQILEIGCSAGGILQYFKDCGHDVQGIDLDPRHVEYAKKKGLNVTLDTMDTVELKERPEYVVMSHVIEHLLDPVGVLKKVREVMHPRGHLYIECPGAGNLLKYDMDFRKSLQLAHVYYFSLGTLEKLIQKCGFMLAQGTEKIQAIIQPLHRVPEKFMCRATGKSASILSERKGLSTPRMITAHPRSGTMYIAHLLQASGVDMRHEQLGKDGIVSWQHICNNEYKVDCDTVIHQVRHPLKVIASTAYTLSSPAFPFIFDCIGQPPNPHPLAVAMWTWIEWNKLIEKRAKCRFRIEDVHLGSLLRNLGFTQGISGMLDMKPDIPKDTNSIPHVPTSWAELGAVDSELCKRVRGLAVKYGYRL